MQLSNRVNQIAASQSLQMAARCRAMRAQGIDVIGMSLGEPDLDTPCAVRRAAQEAIDNHWSHYGPVPGTPELRAAVAAQQNAIEGNAIEWKGTDVVVSVGAKMAIYNAIQTIINPGDEVIVPMPSWVSYTEMVKVAEGVVVPIKTCFDDNYCLTPAQLRAAITPRTRMLILCSPNNPTGSVYSAEQMDALVEVLNEHPQVVLLADEIYNRLVYTAPTTIPSFSRYGELADRLILINGVSKAYAMTGYRIGWLLCKDASFVAACTRLQGQQVTCATMVAQKAAEAALTGSQDCIEQMRQVFAERRELICEMAAKVPGFRFHKPEGAFYLFPDVTAIGKADEVVEYLLEKAHVACVSGSAFGCPDCIRLSYAISTDEIREAMRRIQTAIEQL